MVLFSHSKLRELQLTGGSNLGGNMATLSDGVRAEIPKIMHNATNTGAIVAAWEELKELLEGEKNWRGTSKRHRNMLVVTSRIAQAKV